MDALEVEYTQNYKGFIGDVTDAEFVRSSINEISKLGDIYCLINCAEKACFKKATEYESSDIDMSLMGLKESFL